MSFHYIAHGAKFGFTLCTKYAYNAKDRIYGANMENVDLHLLQMNYLEFLTMYLEGRVGLSLVLQMNERIYRRDHAELSPILLKTTTELYDIKERIDQGEEIGEETIESTINDIVLDLLKALAKGK